jgi:hypothetical protein
VPGADHGPLHNEDYFADVLDPLATITLNYDPNLQKRNPSTATVNTIQPKILFELQEIAKKLARS